MSNLIDPQEAAKLQLSHSLELRRLVVEKLLLGAVVGLAAFAASVVLEKQKQGASDTRLFLEKRLEAGTEVRKAMSDVTTELFGLAAPACQLTLDAPRPPTEKLSQALSSQVRILNTSSLLLSADYLADASRVINIFSGLAEAPPHIPCETRNLVAALADFLTHRTKEEVLPGSVLGWKGFIPLVESAGSVERMGTVDYARKNIDLWNQWSKKQPSN